MKNNIGAIKQRLVPLLEEAVGGFKSFRIGVVLYKDYNEEYLTRITPFTGDVAAIRSVINGVSCHSGRDFPNAVYEALYDAADKFPWANESRLVILIGNSPPHEKPRGSITKEMVDAAAEKRGIKISAIMLPQ